MFLIVWEIDTFKFDKLWINYIKVENLNDLEEKIDFKDITWIISRWAHFKYDKNFLSKFPNLKKLYLLQIWNDNVDFDYCDKNWIEVKNFISQKSIYSVAELTLWGLILWIRQWFYLWNRLKNWIYTRLPLWVNFEGITIWVMWCWRIGQKVIELLENFPCKIITYDIIFWQNTKERSIINLKNRLKNKWIEFTDNLNYFLEKSDYITIHVPWIKSNIWLLDYNKLKFVRWIVNMSRPCVVNENDVLRLLDEWNLEFYVSDVICNEPYVDKMNKRLISHEKVFITPHIWANTYQVQDDIIDKLIDELFKNIRSTKLEK